jgi:hypothetical protein
MVFGVYGSSCSIIVFGSFPQSRFMPCPECGASVERAEADAHMCDSERLLDFRPFQLREEILAFDAQLAAWLASARGRFAAWVAERQARVGLARWIDYTLSASRRGPST